jgi:hypothetical protein
MLAIILTLPPHSLQVSMYPRAPSLDAMHQFTLSISNTRFNRTAHVMDTRFSAGVWSLLGDKGNQPGDGRSCASLRRSGHMGCAVVASRLLSQALFTSCAIAVASVCAGQCHIHNSGCSAWPGFRCGACSLRSNSGWLTRALPADLNNQEQPSLVSVPDVQSDKLPISA